MARALTPLDLLNKKIPKYEFSEEFSDAFGQPAKRGVWFVWGNSGNGKTGFLLQLAKELIAQGDKVIFNSLEEGDSDTMKQSFITQNMIEVQRKILLVEEPISDLAERLRKPKSAKVVIIDSIQYCQFSKKSLMEFCKEFEKTHLIIFNSQAQGKLPIGKIAEAAKFHASLKIWVEGFKAFSHGRYFGPTGQYTIWYERAADYWLSINN